MKEKIKEILTLALYLFLILLFMASIVYAGYLTTTMLESIVQSGEISVGLFFKWLLMAIMTCILTGVLIAGPKDKKKK